MSETARTGDDHIGELRECQSFPSLQREVLKAMEDNWREHEQIDDCRRFMSRPGLVKDWLMLLGSDL